MTTPQEQVEADVKAALKKGDKERLGTLRMLLAEIKNERIRRGGEVDEAAMAALVRKAIKQRHEAAEQFRRGDREESAVREEREAAILGDYLPQQASEEEIRAVVERLVREEDLSGPAAMGQVMRETIARFGPRADGGTVNRIAREVLEGGS
ncbi:MAG TPA: GatB/YqeY domain-containing protein [Thermoanaerobaculia bacterium]|nr:GatB/YqeY domain-containing protein [Thermoanaerobaculia bacterium]